MGRRIAAGRRSMGGVEGGDDYFGRLAKYIPAEIVALYLATKGVVPAAEPDRITILCVIFWVCLVLTPIYLAVTTREGAKGPLWVQVILATIAFPVWVLAVGDGCFALPKGRAFIASLVLMFVTFIFGLIKPPPEDQ
jgi:hypothetical protein